MARKDSEAKVDLGRVSDLVEVGSGVYVWELDPRDRADQIEKIESLRKNSGPTHELTPTKSDE